MFSRRIPVLLSVLFFFLSYTPYAVTVKVTTAMTEPSLGRPMRGLELLPFTLIVSSVMLVVFIWLSGWWRVVPHRFRAGIPIFHIRPWLWLAGIGSTMLLISVPLTYTFPDVSIQMVQLLMRGDLLLVAPIVDLLFGRKVRWYSWTAIAIVAIGLVINLQDRGPLNFPILLWVVLGLYTMGYLLRLSAMTRVAKNDDPDSLKLFFVEERIVAIPLTIGVLGLIALVGDSPAAEELAWGFASVWNSPAIPQLLIISVCLFLITFLTVMILADKHENTYCVPLERSAAVLAGLTSSWILYKFFGQKPVTAEEITGAVLLIVAIVVLALGPLTQRLFQRKWN